MNWVHWFSDTRLHGSLRYRPSLELKMSTSATTPRGTTSAGHITTSNKPGAVQTPSTSGLCKVQYACGEVLCLRQRCRRVLGGARVTGRCARTSPGGSQTVFRSASPVTASVGGRSGLPSGGTSSAPRGLRHEPSDLVHERTLAASAGEVVPDCDLQKRQATPRKQER